MADHPEPGAYRYRTKGHVDPYCDYVWNGERGWYRWPEGNYLNLKSEWHGYTPARFEERLHPHPDADRVWADFVKWQLTK